MSLGVLLATVSLVIAACSTGGLRRQEPSQKTQTAEQTTREHLSLARQALAEQQYRRAEVYYQDVVSRYASDSALLTRAEYLEALDGVCFAFERQQEWGQARKACQRAVAEPGSQSATTLEDVHKALRQQYGQQVDVALKDNDQAKANEALTAYRELPGAKAEKIAAWERRLARVAAEEQRRRAQAEQEEKRQREEQIRRAQQRLLEKWGYIRSLNKQQLETLLMTERTIYGAQFFSDAEISGTQLWLWSPDIERVTMMANWSHFADIADMFTIWCRCDGVTIVGFDMSHMGGGKRPVLTFRFDPVTGRSRTGQQSQPMSPLDLVR